jgi:hypothetical protein
MKRFLLALMLVSGVAYGDTTGNLITNTWNNVTNGTHPNDCCTGGPAPLYDASTNTFHFSYGLTAVHQVQAINQALSGSGIQINGWNWGYDLRNMDGVAGNQNRTTDTISVTSFITNSAGQIVQQSDQYYNTQFDWTRYSGTVTLNSALGIADAGSLGIQFVSRDNGYWAGYYGPQVRDVSLTANYTVDQCTVNPQSNPSCPGYKTYYNMWDDGYAQVPLPFAFPFYGQLFTTSYMYTNGVVGFLNNNWGFCCDGTDLNYQTSQPNSPWNYAIYALNTDLIPGPNSEFYTQVTDNGTGLKYSWVNIPEIGTNLNNTFSVQIKDSGYIGINYQQVNLNPWRNPLVGIAGDISQGQYSITYYGQASGLPALAGTTNVYTGTETTDICAINPLFNSSCPGYADAYFNQQCSINSLYNPSCPGYAAAYLTYQCSINPLYSTTCQGYEQAYFDQQCSISALYNSLCPGYEAAYFTQQCELDGLYSNQCPNYAEAYALKYVVVTSPTPTTTTVATTTPEVISTTGDSTVDAVIKTETTSTTSATATVQLAPTASSTTTSTTIAAATTEAKSDDSTKDDTKKESTKQASSSSSSKSDSGESKTKSARAEARQQAIAKAGKQAAENMDSAASLQAQVAVQGVVIAAMGYTPGFDAYKFMIPDAPGYKPFEIYKKQKNVDNGRMLRGLTGASDKLHEQMTDQQYQNR